MPDFDPSSPEREEVVLSLPDAGVAVSNFSEYQFNSDFLSPADGWWLTIPAERLSDAMWEAIRPGSAVKLSINDSVQSSGYIDSIEITSARGGGTTFRIEGRDRLGQAVDACADPTKSFKPGQTLEDALVSLFSPFGWTAPDHFVADNDANRDVLRGQKRGTRRTGPGRGGSKRKVRDFKLHQLRPHSREGVFEFANRIAERFGLGIWCSADGETLIVSTPDFDQDPTYTLRRNRDGTTNVEEGSVRFDIAEQPTVIIADGYSQSSEFGAGAIKTIIANLAVVTEDPDYLKPFLDYKKAGAKVIEQKDWFGNHAIMVPRNKTQFLHDPESQTQEQLDYFVRRQLALLQRKSLTVSYTVEGHGQDTPDGFVPWAVDTIVDVQDDIARLHEELYVLGRTFIKSRNGGTTTRLTLIRKNTLVF